MPSGPAPSRLVSTLAWQCGLLVLAMDAAQQHHGGPPGAARRALALVTNSPASLAGSEQGRQMPQTNTIQQGPGTPPARHGTAVSTGMPMAHAAAQDRACPSSTLQARDERLSPGPWPTWETLATVGSKPTEGRFSLPPLCTVRPPAWPLPKGPPTPAVPQGVTAGVLVTHFPT